MKLIDCADVPPRERFSYWAETMRSSLYHIEVERTGDDTVPFSGVAEVWQIGDVSLGYQASSSFTAHRSERLIGEHSADMLVVGSPLTNPITTEFPGYPSLHAIVGNHLIFDSDIEWATRTDGNARYQALLIPRRRLRPFVGDVTRIRPRHLVPGQDLYGMLDATIREFPILRGRKDAAAEAAVQILVHLIAVSCGLHPGDDRSVRQSISEARLLQAAQFVGANLHHPGLNAPAVARHLGISVRRLHALYEETGTSVGKQIKDARLTRARQLLAQDLETTVLEIALACGFYSQSTFYRNFTTSLGLTPGEFRKRVERGETIAW